MLEVPEDSPAVMTRGASKVPTVVRVLESGLTRMTLIWRSS